MGGRDRTTRRRKPTNHKASSVRDQLSRPLRPALFGGGGRDRTTRRRKPTNHTASSVRDQLLRPLRPALFGGGGRDRTDDLVLAKHALSQLSYAPWPGTGYRGSGIRTFPIPVVRSLSSGSG